MTIEERLNNAAETLKGYDDLADAPRDLCRFVCEQADIVRQEGLKSLAKTWGFDNVEEIPQISKKYIFGSEEISAVSFAEQLDVAYSKLDAGSEYHKRSQVVTRIVYSACSTLDIDIG